MAFHLLPELSFATRTRDAIRVIRRNPLPDRDRKRLLAEWFQHHGRATGVGGSRRNSYDLLLGRENNTKLRG
mgnify:CR=1 FL=1